MSKRQLTIPDPDAIRIRRGASARATRMRRCTTPEPSDAVARAHAHTHTKARAAIRCRRIDERRLAQIISGVSGFSEYYPASAQPLTPRIFHPTSKEQEGKNIHASTSRGAGGTHHGCRSRHTRRRGWAERGRLRMRSPLHLNRGRSDLRSDNQYQIQFLRSRVPLSSVLLEGGCRPGRFRCRLG